MACWIMDLRPGTVPADPLKRCHVHMESSTLGFVRAELVVQRRPSRKLRRLISAHSLPLRGLVVERSQTAFVPGIALMSTL